MAQDPDPSVELTTARGVTRTLDDWTTSFHLALTVLPGRPEAASYVRIGKRIADVLGGSDCRPAFVIIGNERAARRVLGSALDDYLCFLDPEGNFVKACGLARLPAFVHIRVDGSLAGAAEGWDPQAWDEAVERLAKEMAWTRPLIPAPGDPAPFAGWNT
ncbi:MAG TPA: hypothetical protein VG795_05335 [Acidimicrobiia bacterium]|nr:hypothetical protein [Acidimicrobiia bacterium]